MKTMQQVIGAMPLDEIARRVRKMRDAERLRNANDGRGGYYFPTRGIVAHMAQHPEHGTLTEQYVKAFCAKNKLTF